MDKNKNDLIIESIGISYQDKDGEKIAKSLQSNLSEQLNLKIKRPSEIKSNIIPLGIEEIIFVIILTESVTRLLKTIFDIIRYKVDKGIIIIKLNENDLGRPFSFSKGTLWEKLLDNIDQYIKKRKRKTLTELIEEMVELDKKIRKLFEMEATFLDIDVVSSKKLREKSDVTISAYSFEQYYKYVKDKVKMNGGIVLSAVGDEVMSFFKKPDNAINCALDIFNDKEKFNNNRNKLKDPFQFRVGINSGSALIDTKTGKAFSRGVIDLAGHLQKKAKPGTFLISEDTYCKLKNKDDFKRYKYIKRDKIWSYIFSKFLDDRSKK